MFFQSEKWYGKRIENQARRKKRKTKFPLSLYFTTFHLLFIHFNFLIKKIRNVKFNKIELQHIRIALFKNSWIKKKLKIDGATSNLRRGYRDMLTD